MKGKPIIMLVEPDASHGGLSLEEVRAQLVNAVDQFDKWGFDADAPRGQTLYDHLFSKDPNGIEWNRIGHFRTAIQIEPTAVATYADRFVQILR